MALTAVFVCDMQMFPFFLLPFFGGWRLAKGVGKGVYLLWLWNEPPYVKASAAVLASVLFTVTLSHLIRMMLIASKIVMLRWSDSGSHLAAPHLCLKGEICDPKSLFFLFPETWYFPHWISNMNTLIPLIHFLVVNVLNSCYFKIQEGLSPNHLKKAKLMFFYTRYPSSNMLKMYFSDVKVS